LLILSVLTGIFTFSRAYILLFTILLFVYVLLTKRKTITIILISISIACVIYFFAFALENVIEGFTGRFDEQDVSGGRVDLFKQYNEIWSSKISYMLFGVGAICSRHLDVGESMHNATQQIYVSYGIVGIIVFVAVILAFKKRYIGANTSLMYFLPFFACFAYSQSIQFWNPYYLIFPYLATAYAIKNANSTSSNCKPSLMQ
jgi:O-antigen ligase